MWDATVTWIDNLLTFTIWYWFLDPSRTADTAIVLVAQIWGFPQQTSTIPGWGGLDPGRAGLPLCGIQHQHLVQYRGHGGSVPQGKGPVHASVRHLPGHHRHARGQGCKHDLVMSDSRDSIEEIGKNNHKLSTTVN